MVLTAAHLYRNILLPDIIIELPQPLFSPVTEAYMNCKQTVIFKDQRSDMLGHQQRVHG
jgi:hypothetical protein